MKSVKKQEEMKKCFTEEGKLSIQCMYMCVYTYTSIHIDHVCQHVHLYLYKLHDGRDGILR